MFCPLLVDVFFPSEDPLENRDDKSREQIFVDKIACDNGPLTFSNINVIGSYTCAGTFNNGNKAVQDKWFPDTGFVISTGNPVSLHLQNSDWATTIHDSPGDEDLSEMCGAETYDACGLEFEFECTHDYCSLQMEYVWGSEEYLEHINDYNDLMGIFLDGKNIALIPGTDIPVGIQTINLEKNSEWFINNDPGANDDFFADDGYEGYDATQNMDDWVYHTKYPNMEADGFTKNLSIQKVIKGGVKHTMKIVVADQWDPAFDSWVLIKKDSFCAEPADPPMGGGGGDPHFKRWGHKKRDSFHGECDLVALQADNFHGHGIDFHVRTKIVSEETFSLIDSAAVRVGHNIVEVHNTTVFLDGVAHHFTEIKDDPLVFGDNKQYSMSIKEGSIQIKNDKVRHVTYRLNLDGDTEIEFRYFYKIMTFNILGHADFNNAKGLLGSYPTGEMIGRTGDMLDNFDDFGMEWQVNENDPDLFLERLGPQLPLAACRMPLKASKESRRKLRVQDRVLHEAAEAACEKATDNEHNMELCIDDVMMTGDIDIAGEW